MSESIEELKREREVAAEVAAEEAETLWWNVWKNGGNFEEITKRLSLAEAEAIEALDLAILEQTSFSFLKAVELTKEALELAKEEKQAIAKHKENVVNLWEARVKAISLRAAAI